MNIKPVKMQITEGNPNFITSYTWWRLHEEGRVNIRNLEPKEFVINTSDIDSGGWVLRICELDQIISHNNRIYNYHFIRMDTGNETIFMSKLDDVHTIEELLTVVDFYTI